jgi:Domain of unknown function (DUF4287)
MVKADYWKVTDEQVVEKTGRPIEHWMAVLKKFGAETKKSAEAVSHLQNEHAVPRYWARTLTTGYLKNRAD